MQFSGFFQSELGDAPYVMAHLRVGGSTFLLLIDKKKQKINLNFDEKSIKN